MKGSCSEPDADEDRDEGLENAGNMPKARGGDEQGLEALRRRAKFKVLKRHMSIDKRSRRTKAASIRE